MSPLCMILGGLKVSYDASHSISQDYEPLVSETILRMANGTGVKQTLWSGKTKITTRGQGRFPPGLRGLDYSASMVLECVTSIAVDSVSNVITIPSARRSDVDLLGLALVDGRSVHAGVTLAGNVATLDTISGAAAYQVLYFPKFTVFASRPVENNSARQWGQHGWSLVCEEV